MTTTATTRTINIAAVIVVAIAIIVVIIVNTSVIPQRTAQPEAQEQQDIYERFVQVRNTCIDEMDNDVNPTTSPNGCRQTFNDAMERWCGLEFYDATLCEEASDISRSYESMPD